MGRSTGRGWLAVLLVCGIAGGIAGLSPDGATAEDAPTSPTAAPPDTDARMSSDDFLASPAAQFLASGDAARALEALEGLATQYPGDPLIARYRGMTLDRLGRTREAVAVYQELLARDPDHVPTHFFLGEAHDHLGDRRAAVREWRWVVAHSPAEQYRAWARARLAGRAEAPPTGPQPEPWYVIGLLGLEHDNNPLLTPNDRRVAASGDEPSAERFSVNAEVGRHLVRRPDLRMDASYTVRQSVHDHGVNEVNFTHQEVALDATKRISVWQRDVLLGAAYELAVGFLQVDLFAVSNALRLSAETRPVPRTRTVLFHRAAVTNFGPDGSTPSRTSRDGFYDDTGITQYLYSADYRRYVFVGEEFNLAQTRGANFIQRGASTRVGVHTPVPSVPKTDLDVSGGFEFGRYPDFRSLSSADRDRRSDANWDVYAALTYYWTSQVASRVFYRYVNADNRNNVFQYDRDIVGVQLLFIQGF